MDRYLHDLVQYALGVLHIVTLVPYSRKPILNAMLSSDRVGIAVILDAANGAGYPDPEVNTSFFWNCLFFLGAGGSRPLMLIPKMLIYIWKFFIFLFSDNSSGIECVGQSCLPSSFNQ